MALIECEKILRWIEFEGTRISPSGRKSTYFMTIDTNDCCLFGITYQDPPLLDPLAPDSDVELEIPLVILRRSLRLLRDQGEVSLDDSMDVFGSFTKKGKKVNFETACGEIHEFDLDDILGLI
jgi:hypothetical protein